MRALRGAGVPPAVSPASGRQPERRRGRRRNGRRDAGPTLAALAILLLVAIDAHACAVCWGSPNDPMVKGANNGIWVLLGVIAVVQAGFIALFWSFWRRGREQKRFRESLRVIHPFDPVENSMRPMQGGPQS